MSTPLSSVWILYIKSIISLDNMKSRIHTKMNDTLVVTKQHIAILLETRLYEQLFTRTWPYTWNRLFRINISCQSASVKPTTTGFLSLNVRLKLVVPLRYLNPLYNIPMFFTWIWKKMTYGTNHMSNIWFITYYNIHQASNNWDIRNFFFVSLHLKWEYSI